MRSRPTDEQDFLAELGRRVRHVRALRGMSRKVLARVSGISERYIAQLESGNGNVSIKLLRRVSAAMGTRIEDLIIDDTAPSDWPVFRDLIRTAASAQIAQARAILSGAAPASSAQPDRAGIDRVALIGLRGAGKSTLGRIVAERLGFAFVELNREIERAHGLSLAEILALYGQEGYRRREQAALREVVARPGPMILATGGGIVAEPLTFDLLLDLLLHGLAQGRARGAHGAGAPAGRPAPDGRRPHRHAGAAGHPGEPRAALSARAGHGRYVREWRSKRRPKD